MTDNRTPVDLSGLDDTNHKAVTQQCYLTLLNAGGEDGDWWEIAGELGRRPFWVVLNEYFVVRPSDAEWDRMSAEERRELDPDEERDWTPQPPERIEFTVGVMVPFTWDRDSGSYKLLRGEVKTTTGGLFSDAEEGHWVPSEEEWSSDFEHNEDRAAHTAWTYVERAVTPS